MLVFFTTKDVLSKAAVLPNILLLTTIYTCTVLWWTTQMQCNAQYMVLWNMDQLILWTAQTHTNDKISVLFYTEKCCNRNERAQMTHPELTCCLALHKYSSMMDLHKCIALVSSPDPTSRGSGNETSIAHANMLTHANVLTSSWCIKGISAVE